MTARSYPGGRARDDLRRRWRWRLDDNPLVRAVGRVPTTLYGKLVAAMVGMVILLVALGVLGLGVLGSSNSRVETLGKLQQRTATYQDLEAYVTQLRILLGVRAGGSDADVYAGSPPATPGSIAAVDSTIVATLSRLGPATEEKNLGFVPPPSERAILHNIQSTYRQLSDEMTTILASDRAGKSDLILSAGGESVATALVVLAGQLVDTTKLATTALTTKNASSYTNSQHLFVAVAAGSVALAVLLGVILSRSLIGPIRRMDNRLAAIAAGDFAGHVDVANRDELGALAANLNRMNDELGRLYEELETVSQHKSDFLAGMSHELRTPLNAIIGFSEVLGQRMFGDLNERQSEYVEDIRTAGQHLLSLINDILDLSKVEAGKMDLDIRPVSVPDVLSSGVTMHRERAMHHRIALLLNVAHDVAIVEADERRVRQVVFNLLSNALKFTPDGGSVVVSARTVDSMVEISVADTGVGIAPEDTERIFEEFQQASGTSSAGHEGTGLGLALSRKFVELHRGRLWVTSIQGGGSTFCFTLPVSQAEVLA